MFTNIIRLTLTVLFVVLVLLSSRTLADQEYTIYLPLVIDTTEHMSADLVLAHLIAGTSQLYSHAIVWAEWLDYNEFEDLRLLGHNLATAASEIVFNNLDAAGDPRRAALYQAALISYSTMVCYDGDQYNDWITHLPAFDSYRIDLLAYADILLSACTQGRYIGGHA